MKKRTLKAGQFQRHYATNGIQMQRERLKLIEVPEGTLVTILKARRQTHLATIRCVVNAEGLLVLGSGKKAVDICIGIPVDFLPKLMIGDQTKPTAKGGKKGSTKKNVVSETATETLPAVNEEQPAGIGAEEIALPVETAPAAVETPAPVVEQPVVVEAPVAEVAAV